MKHYPRRHRHLPCDVWEGIKNLSLRFFAAKWMKTVHTTYNFVGDVLDTEERVYTYSNGIVLLAGRRTCNTYHPSTRLLETTTVTHIDKNGNTSSQVISNPAYDVFGNVTANDRPGTAADMAYSYDTLHGWLKGVFSPCGFSEQLQRETAANAQFSGSIGSMQWRNTGNGEQHKYDYTYDGLGRLTDALYSSSGNGTEGRYDESVSYNSNGSITTLQRNGMRNDGTFGAIDDLSIDYDGNRLLKVTDDAEALNYNGALDFTDGDDTDCEYRYDSNGALTYDGNRGISSISYDYGHHPRSISLGTKKYITNDYTPDGRKLSSQHVAYIPKGNGANRRISVYDLYVDGLILRKGAPLLWQFDGGYVDLDDNGSPTGWNYYVTDHLGSTRMVVGSDSIRETINYYPFGSEMTMQDPALMNSDFQHPYRFTGKELDRVNGLNMYDFGARLFDVAGVPMWTSVDPLAEKYYNISPYAYCAGDPVNKFDPDGRDWLQSQGDSVYWYGGDLGDNSDLQYTFAATSGYKDDNVDYQRAMFQDIEDKGPTPEGDYFINLELDPSRTVPYEIINDRPIIKRGQGIEKVEIHYEGMLYTSPDWGTIRAKLEPQTIKNKCSRDINSFYMHNSTKGFTHGCTEVETTLFDMLVFYRERGHKKIDVRVQYPSKNHKTNGGTKR